MILEGGVTLGLPWRLWGSEGSLRWMPYLEDRRRASGVRRGRELRRLP